MKYIKRFEMNDDEPKIGDYVICETLGNKIYNNFIEGKIGKILKVNLDNVYSYDITYDDIPSMLYTRIINGQRTITFKSDQIVYFSNNKEELEQILMTNKFNI